MNGGGVSVLTEVREQLGPAVAAIEKNEAFDPGEVMNLLGRLVAVVEHLAERVDEVGLRLPTEP
jgi:hypothetical protein